MSFGFVHVAGFTVAVGVIAGVSASLPAAQTVEVNVYSYRQPFLVEPLFKAFTAQTGIKVNTIFAKKGLIERMKAEGANSPADVLLTTDIGRLNKAVVSGVSQSLETDVLSKNIPARYRDPDGRWFGLTLRSRVIYASKQRVKQTAFTYEELADPKWKGRICVRSGQNVYNIALIASMIANNGEADTKKWLEGFKANLARKPSGNDRGQVKAVFSGECDIAIGNTYYMGKMQTNDKKPEQKEWARSVRIIFPNTNGRGAHVNLSGMVLAKYAPHRSAAIKLMNFLSEDKAQKIYAEVNYEYPVKPGVEWSKLVKSWGEFKADTVSLVKIAKYRKRASELVDEVGFNNGPSS